MKINEMTSGAPLFRGRWAAIFWLWVSGAMAGDMDLGLVWLFIPDAAHIGHTHWSIDALLGIGSIFCLVAGIMCLDQYGRNAWFAWAPDETEWGGFTRSDVNRKNVFQIPTGSRLWAKLRR